MKRTAIAVALGSLLAFQAAFAQGFISAIPEQMEADESLAALSTYADEHAGDPVTLDGPAFPVFREAYDSLAPLGTYADKHANDPVTRTDSAFPGTNSND